MQTSSVVAVTAGLGGGGLGVGGVMGMGAPSYTLQIILLALTQCELFRIKKICSLALCPTLHCTFWFQSGPRQHFKTLPSIKLWKCEKWRR